ncbi:MAG: hypothetical protein RLZZ324_165 [Candidatus Parcubacteria bacterium]|jgi:uncharacterized membrane protein YphA (DoxX/SURF4 family)
MNFRNRKLIIAVRVLLGLFFIMSGVTGWLAGAEMNGVPPEMVAGSKELWRQGIFQLIKTTEIVAGTMLVTGFLPWLASIVLAPLCIGIIVVNARISPQYLPGGYFVVVLNAFLGYAYWDAKYKQLFDRKW